MHEYYWIAAHLQMVNFMLYELFCNLNIFYLQINSLFTPIPTPQVIPAFGFFVVLFFFKTGSYVAQTLPQT